VAERTTGNGRREEAPAYALVETGTGMLNVLVMRRQRQSGVWPLVVAMLGGNARSAADV